MAGAIAEVVGGVRRDARYSVPAGLSAWILIPDGSPALGFVRAMARSILH